MKHCIIFTYLPNFQNFQLRHLSEVEKLHRTFKVDNWSGQVEDLGVSKRISYRITRRISGRISQLFVIAGFVDEVVGKDLDVAQVEHFKALWTCKNIILG